MSSSQPMFSASNLGNFIDYEHVVRTMPTRYSQLTDSASISSVNVLPAR
jgi:hypothetical protein